MAPPLLLLQDVRLDIGGEPLLDGAELAVAARDRLCLVGRNGSGKSTLLKIAAGMVEPDGGTRFLQPSTTIRYLPQEPDLSGFNTTLAFVEAGLASGDDAADAEISWQLAHMTEPVRTALRQLPLLGEDASGPLGSGLLASGVLGSIIRKLQTGLVAPD